MNNAVVKPLRLGAEHFLLGSLSAQWQARMATAIQLIRQHFNETIDWDWLAQQCAVSSSHFHYVFKKAFNEGPGQFQRRIRLQYALSQLQLSDKNVTEIALESGFSSSQALAKALRRVLGLCASDMRHLCETEGAYVWQKLLPKLGQPHPDYPESLDNSVLKDIEVRTVHVPERHLYLLEANALSISQIYNACGKYLPFSCDKVFVYSPWSACAEPSQSSYYWGYEAEESISNYTIPARNYLSATVVVDSEASYLMVWESIYRRAISLGLSLDTDAFLYDELSVIPAKNDGLEISIAIPVLTEVENQQA